MSARTDTFALIEDHYREHRKEFINKLRFALGNIQNAEDTVQEAYTRALTYWKAYDKNKGLDAWIGTILTNCIKDKQRDSILLGMVSEDLAVMPEPARIDITDVVFAKELKDTISRLPITMSYPLYLYLFEGYTSREIAEITEQNANSIRKMVSRFRDSYLAAA